MIAFFCMDELDARLDHQQMPIKPFDKALLRYRRVQNERQQIDSVRACRGVGGLLTFSKCDKLIFSPEIEVGDYRLKSSMCG